MKNTSNFSLKRYILDKSTCTYTDNSSVLFNVSFSNSTIARFKLLLNIVNQDTDACDIHEVNNAFRCIDGNVIQIGDDDILTFTNVDNHNPTVIYNKMCNKLNVSIYDRDPVLSNCGNCIRQHLHFTSRLEIIVFQGKIKVNH